MDSLKIDDIRLLVRRLKMVAAESKDYLIELDSIMGDGDMGLTMAAAFTALDDFASSYTEPDVGVLFMKGGMAMAKAAPSTMGTLMATGFMRGGKVLKGMESVELPQLCEFWKAFVEGLMERGKAEPGDKTIIDALYPAVLSLTLSVENGDSIGVAADNAALAAEDGLKASKEMIAQHGRAAYYQEKSRGLQDPGATMGNIIIKVFADFLNEREF